MQDIGQKVTNPIREKTLYLINSMRVYNIIKNNNYCITHNNDDIMLINNTYNNGWKKKKMMKTTTTTNENKNSHSNEQPCLNFYH